jgi:hypothetical protein
MFVTSNHLLYAVLIMAVLASMAAACSKSEDAKQASGPGASEQKAGARSSEPAVSGEHAHAAPHGGMVKSTSGGHIELVAARDGTFKVWLLDADQRPRTVPGASVAIKVATKGYGDVVTAVAGDHFEGTGAPIVSDHVTAMVTADVGGSKETARFELHLEGDPTGSGRDGHGDHGQAGGH